MVIKMKSVEYMPFLLSFFLFLNGGIWSIYAALVKDFFVGVPNAIGFIFGSAQIIIYAIYKNKSKKSTEKIDEEKGSVTFVKGAVEIKAKSGVDDKKDNSKNVSLHRGRSLPQPIVKRLHAMPTKLMKTESLSSHEMNSVWDFGVDLESGEKNHP